MKKTKKQLRKEATLLANRISQNLKHANECNDDPLSKTLSAFTSIQVKLRRRRTKSKSQTKEEASNETDEDVHNNKNVTIQFYKSLPERLLQPCLDLFRQNMGHMYNKSSWGLNMEEKKKELLHESARFLLVIDDGDDIDSERLQSSGRRTGIGSANDDNDDDPHPHPQLLAFSHFRFEVDDDDQPTQEVLYLYEIQISPVVQRSGMGKRFMQILEIMAMQMKMRSVMLTVFKINQDAMTFYQKLKYDIDESSPSRFGDEADYEILSKIVYSEVGEKK